MCTCFARIKLANIYLALVFLFPRSTFAGADLNTCKHEIVVSACATFGVCVLVFGAVLFCALRCKARRRNRDEQAARRFRGKENCVYDKDDAEQGGAFYDEENATELGGPGSRNRHDSGFATSSSESINPLSACLPSDKCNNHSDKTSSHQSSSVHSDYSPVSDISVKFPSTTNVEAGVPVAQATGGDVVEGTGSVRWHAESLSPSAQANRELVTLRKKAVACTGVDFGISGVFIRALDWDQVSIAEGSLSPGDEVVSINGLRVVGMSDMEAFALFSNATCQVVFEVVRGACISKLQDGSVLSASGGIPSPAVSSYVEYDQLPQVKASSEECSWVQESQKVRDPSSVSVLKKNKSDSDLKVQSSCLDDAEVEKNGYYILGAEIMSQLHKLKERESVEGGSGTRSACPQTVEMDLLAPSHVSQLDGPASSNEHPRLLSLNGGYEIVSSQSSELKPVVSTVSVFSACEDPLQVMPGRAQLNGMLKESFSPLSRPDSADVREHDTSLDYNHNRSHAVEHFRQGRSIARGAAPAYFGTCWKPPDDGQHSRSTSDESFRHSKGSSADSSHHSKSESIVMGQHSRSASVERPKSRGFSGDNTKHGRNSSGESSVVRVPPCYSLGYVSRSMSGDREDLPRTSFQAQSSGTSRLSESAFTIDGYATSLSAEIYSETGGTKSYTSADMQDPVYSGVYQPSRLHLNLRPDGVIVQRGYATDYIVPRSNAVGVPPSSSVFKYDAGHRGRDTSPARRTSPVVMSNGTVVTSVNCFGAPQKIGRPVGLSVGTRTPPFEDLPKLSASSKASSRGSTPPTSPTDYIGSAPKIASRQSSVDHQHGTSSSLEAIGFRQYPKDVIEIDPDVRFYMNAKYSEPRFPITCHVPATDPPPYEGTHTTVASKKALFGVLDSVTSVTSVLEPRKSYSSEPEDWQLRNCATNFQSLLHFGAANLNDLRKTTVYGVSESTFLSASSDECATSVRRRRMRDQRPARPHSLVDAGLGHGACKDLELSAIDMASHDRGAEEVRVPPKRARSMPAVKCVELRPASAQIYLGSACSAGSLPTSSAATRGTALASTVGASAGAAGAGARKVRSRRQSNVNNVDRRKSIDSGTLRKLAEELKVNPSLSGEFPLISRLLNESQFSALGRRSRNLYRHKSTDALYSQF